MPNIDRLTQMLMQLLAEGGTGLSLPLRRMLARLTASLLEGTPLQITALAEALPDLDTSQAVKEHRMRRFLSNPHISPAHLLPVFVRLLQPVWSRMPEIVLALDRPHWKKRRRDINILMVSVTVHGRALPLFWKVWNRAGNSAFADWCAVLTPVLQELRRQDALQGGPVIVVADREFASPRLAEWLKTTAAVDSVLRLKRSAYLCDQTHTVLLADLLRYFPQGETRSYRQMTVTKASHFPVNVTLPWGLEYEEPLLLVTTLPLEATDLPVARYQQRFWIEPRFNDQQSNGFDLERTRVTDAKRIDTFVLLSALAHLFCSCEGYHQELQGVLKKNAWFLPHSPTGAVFRRVQGVSTTASTSHGASV
jgi:hypothetical protein